MKAASTVAEVLKSNFLCCCAPPGIITQANIAFPPSLPNFSRTLITFDAFLVALLLKYAEQGSALRAPAGLLFSLENIWVIIKICTSPFCYTICCFYFQIFEFSRQNESVLVCQKMREIQVFQILTFSWNLNVVF